MEFVLVSSFQTPDNGAYWLQNEIETYNYNKNSKLRIPKSKDNKQYKLEDLNTDQFTVAYIILDKI